MKTKLSVVVLAFMALTAQGQKVTPNYRISGDLKGLKDGWIYKMADGRESIDSVFAKSGKFSFSGVAETPGRVMIYRRGDNLNLSFFVDKNAEIQISGDSRDLASAKITGGISQAEYQDLKSRTAQINRQLQALYKEESEDEASMKKEEALSKELDSVSKKFILDKPSSFVSLATLNDLIYSVDLTEFETLYQSLDPAVKSSTPGRRMADLIEKKKKTSIGKLAPEFSAPDTLGKTVSLSSFKGKYVLVDFWASWCGPCREENPHVLKAYNKFKDKGFTVFAVSRDTNQKAWLKAIKEDQLPWTQVIDSNKGKLAADLYGVTGIPASFLIDPAGKILAVDLRGDDLTNALAAILNK
ncbi:TlpA disulfide reductase family protein [Pedobacter panaciterrae]|uniref:TlpA disulfide reductase family protein n=1 Tax=Pedobacter panaciterrae TaxID=363849 RepID=A0ABU8NII6_9SPHI